MIATGVGCLHCSVGPRHMACLLSRSVAAQLNGGVGREASVRAAAYQWPLPTDSVDKIGCGSTSGLSVANFRSFWAVAARWNSSRAPQGPRNRSRSSSDDAFEVREQHLDLLALTPRDDIGVG